MSLDKHIYEEVFWKGRGELLPNWPKLLHALFLHQLLAVLQSLSLTFQLPTLDSPGMVIIIIFSTSY